MRLNGSLRCTIEVQVVRAIEDKYKPKGRDLADDFAVRVYNHLVPSELQAQIDALPDGVMLERTSFDVNIGGRNVELRLPQSRRAPAYVYQWPRRIIEDSSLVAEYTVYIRYKHRGQFERSRLSANVWHLLHSVTTLEAAVKAWPGLMEWLSPDLTAKLNPKARPSTNEFSVKLGVQCQGMLEKYMEAVDPLFVKD